MSPFANSSLTFVLPVPADKDQRPILSFVIVGWIAFLSTLISLVLVSLAARKAKKHHATNGGYSPEARDEMTNATTTAPASTVGA
jgi:hypothetical protein